MFSRILNFVACSFVALCLIVICASLLSGCAVAVMNDNVETGKFKGAIFGIGSAESAQGGKMSVLKIPDTIGANR